VISDTAESGMLERGGGGREEGTQTGGGRGGQGRVEANRAACVCPHVGECDLIRGTLLKEELAPADKV
jgi:hypothetical protein